MNRALLLSCCLLLLGCPPSNKTLASATPPPGKTGEPAGGSTAPVDNRPRRGDVPQLESLLVEGGEFVMGTEGGAKGGRDNERPRATRRCESFSIDRFEVTNAAYAKFLASPDSSEHVFCHADEPAEKDHRPGKPSPEERGWGAHPDPFGDPARATHPVVSVDWFDAYAYAQWSGRRLPSEDAVARAARPTGSTEPVGSCPKGAAPSGALDMAGNVWEWTDSSYLRYQGAPEGTEENPDHKVLRGGGWSSATGLLLRAAVRHDRPRTYRSAALGFRTAGAPSDLRGAK